MAEIIPFFSPRFVGSRFENHTLPLEVLKDIAALEELVVELAKWLYIQEHQGRRRTPKQFTEGISLGITSIEDGSAIPNIVIQMATAAMTIFPPENQQYFNRAKDQIIRTVEAAEKGQPITGIPTHLLGYFDKLGRSLKEGESVEFNPKEPNEKAILNRDSRRRLVLASQVQEIREEVKIRGIVSAMDKDNQTFVIDLIDGQKVASPYELQHEPIISEAFNTFRQTDPLRMIVAGTAVYSRNNASKIQRLDGVDHVSILDPLDISSRLAELRQLKDGWLEGKGRALSEGGCVWFEQTFELNYPDDLNLPFLFPTGEGGLLAEWAFSPNQSSLEVNLDNKTGFFHNLNLDTDEDYEISIDLSASEGWEELNRNLRRFSTTQA